MIQFFSFSREVVVFNTASLNIPHVGYRAPHPSATSKSPMTAEASEAAARKRMGHGRRRPIHHDRASNEADEEEEDLEEENITPGQQLPSQPPPSTPGKRTLAKCEEEVQAAAASANEIVQMAEAMQVEHESSYPKSFMMDQQRYHHHSRHQRAVGGAERQEEDEGDECMDTPPVA